jgi:hypothetical protein
VISVRIRSIFIPTYEQFSALALLTHSVSVPVMRKEKKNKLFSPRRWPWGRRSWSICFITACTVYVIDHQQKKNWRAQMELPWTMAPCSLELISKISSHLAVFFSHNEPANSTFNYNKPAKRTGRGSRHTMPVPEALLPRSTACLPLQSSCFCNGWQSLGSEARGGGWGFIFVCLLSCSLVIRLECRFFFLF